MTVRDRSSRVVQVGAGYLRRHPVAALATVGEQVVLGLTTIRFCVTRIVGMTAAPAMKAACRTNSAH